MLRHWWVNQKQTHRHEIGGGYLWSPKRKADNTRHQYYENMKAVAPGDLVFCYWNTAIRAIGRLGSFGYDSPKPEEFGAAGRNWSLIGYRADVDYVELTRPVSPRDHWRRIQPLLPAKYSPLNSANGRGLQSVYLAELPTALGQLLWELVTKQQDLAQSHLLSDPRMRLIRSAEEPERDSWERHLVAELDNEPIETTSDADVPPLVAGIALRLGAPPDRRAGAVEIEHRYLDSPSGRGRFGSAGSPT